MKKATSSSSTLQTVYEELSIDLSMLEIAITKIQNNIQYLISQSHIYIKSQKHYRLHKHNVIALDKYRQNH